MEEEALPNAEMVWEGCPAPLQGNLEYKTVLDILGAPVAVPDASLRGDPRHQYILSHDTQ